MALYAAYQLENKHNTAMAHLLDHPAAIPSRFNKDSFKRLGNAHSPATVHLHRVKRLPPLSPVLHQQAATQDTPKSSALTLATRMKL